MQNSDLQFSNLMGRVGNLHFLRVIHGILLSSLRQLNFLKLSNPPSPEFSPLKKSLKRFLECILLKKFPYSWGHTLARLEHLFLTTVVYWEKITSN